MKLTSFTDYSIRLLMYVAINKDDLVSVKEVAGVFNISKNHLMKIVHELGKEGYLETVRGKNGGFRIGKPPKDINMGKLVRFTEDDLNVVECFNEETNNCKIVNHCMFAGVLQMALDAFFDVLDGHNLDDLIEDKIFIASLLRPPEQELF